MLAKSLYMQTSCFLKFTQSVRETVFLILEKLGKSSQNTINAVCNVFGELGKFSFKGDIFKTTLSRLAVTIRKSISAIGRMLNFMHEAGLIEKRSNGRGIEFRLLVVPGPEKNTVQLLEAEWGVSPASILAEDETEAEVELIEAPEVAEVRTEVPEIAEVKLIEVPEVAEVAVVEAPEVSEVRTEIVSETVLLKDQIADQIEEPESFASKLEEAVAFRVAEIESEGKLKKNRQAAECFLKSRMKEPEITQVLERKYAKLIEERKERERRELQLAKKRSAVEKRQLAEEQLRALMESGSEKLQRLISLAKKRLPKSFLDARPGNIVRQRRMHKLMIGILMNGDY